MTEVAKAPTPVDEGSPAVCKSEFLEKVTDIPVVKGAKDIGTAAYNHVKGMNRLTNFTLNKAESTVLFLALSAKPFLEKWQPQAKAVDHIASRSLEVLEAKIPYMMKSPEEMVEDARRLCSATLGSGIQKVEEIKSKSTETLSSVKAYGLQKANDYLDDTENLVEKYLPPAFGESSQEGLVERSDSLSERATQLTTKIGQRVYDHGIKNYAGIQRLTQDSISKLHFTLELIEFVKENYAGKSMQECVDDAKLRASWIWNELNKEPAVEQEQAHKSLEQRLLSLARRLTSTLVHTYSTVPSLKDLPQTCSDNAQSALDYAMELFLQFDEATNAGNIGTAILNKAKTTILILENAVRSLVEKEEDDDDEELEMQLLASSTNESASPNESMPKESASDAQS